jgi:hypothetical protein
MGDFVSHPTPCEPCNEPKKSAAQQAQRVVDVAHAPSARPLAGCAHICSAGDMTGGAAQIRMKALSALGLVKKNIANIKKPERKT